MKQNNNRYSYDENTSQNAFSMKNQGQSEADSQSQEPSDEGFSILNTIRNWKDNLFDGFGKKIIDNPLLKQEKLNEVCRYLSPYCENNPYETQEMTIPEWKIEEMETRFSPKEDELEELSPVNETQNRYRDQDGSNVSFEPKRNNRGGQTPSFINPHRIKRGDTLNTQIYPRNNFNQFSEKYQSGLPASYGTKMNGMSQESLPTYYGAEAGYTQGRGGVDYGSNAGYGQEGMVAYYGSNGYVPSGASAPYYGTQGGGYNQGRTAYYGSNGYVPSGASAPYYGAQGGGYNQGRTAYYGSNGYAQEKPPITYYGSQRIEYAQPVSEADRNFMKREQMYLDQIKSLQEDLDFERSFSNTFLRKRR